MIDSDSFASDIPSNLLQRLRVGLVDSQAGKFRGKHHKPGDAKRRLHQDLSLGRGRGQTGGVKGPCLFAIELLRIASPEQREQILELFGPRRCRLQPNHNRIRPKQVSSLQLSVAFVANFDGRWGCQPSQPYARFRFNRTDGYGERHLFGVFRIRLKDNQNIAHETTFFLLESCRQSTGCIYMKYFLERA